MIRCDTARGQRVFRNAEEVLSFVGEHLGDDVKEALYTALSKAYDEKAEAERELSSARCRIEELEELIALKGCD